MPGALSSTAIATIKTALQIPFDTFAYFPFTLVKRQEAFGVFKELVGTEPFNLVGYKIQDDKQVPTTLKGVLNIVGEKILINPRNLAEQNLLDGYMKAIITVGQDRVESEGREYEILEVHNIGWFDYEYMLVILVVQQLAAYGDEN